jgi:hypothetical protein
MLAPSREDVLLRLVTINAGRPQDLHALVTLFGSVNAEVARWLVRHSR